MRDVACLWPSSRCVCMCVKPHYQEAYSPWSFSLPHSPFPAATESLYSGVTFSVCFVKLLFGLLLTTLPFRDVGGGYFSCALFSSFTLPSQQTPHMQWSAWHNYSKQWGSHRGTAPVNMLNQKETAGQSVPCSGIKNGWSNILFIKFPSSFFFHFFFLPTRSRSSSSHAPFPLFLIMMAVLCSFPLRCLSASPFQMAALNL